MFIQHRSYFQLLRICILFRSANNKCQFVCTLKVTTLIRVSAEMVTTYLLTSIDGNINVAVTNSHSMANKLSLLMDYVTFATRHGILFQRDWTPLYFLFVTFRLRVTEIVDLVAVVK